MSAAAPIRLFVDAHVFDGPHQGTRSFIQGLYTQVANRPGITLLLAANDPAKLQETFGESDNVVLLRYRSRSRYGRLLLEIPRMLREHRVDYAHFQYITPLSKPCFYVVTTHDVLFSDLPGEFSIGSRLLKKWLYRRSAHAADILTTVSAHARRSIGHHLGVKEDRVHLVPNAVAPHFFDGGDAEAAAAWVLRRYGIGRFILFVGRIEPRKNHALVVRVFGRLGLARRGYHLVLIGNKTNEAPALTVALNALADADRDKIVFLDGVADCELVQFYRAAAVFVYPSKGEGFGIPPLEAAAVQTPVICARGTALESFDFFGDDHIDADDEHAFTERLACLLRQPRNHGMLRERAAIVRRRYSWKASAHSFITLIQDHHRNQTTHDRL
jgi:glycosyltransferase involved in cell wall biosynthesis